ncbi:hypothetical protein PMIT1303_01571 [Prochlorococcus sp. MIT 1303]|nr:hypothetical protein PMIT1303_01571 [Prochlorococcus sp. MIT 1303]
MKVPNILLLLTLLISLPAIAEEEQKKPKKQPELTPVIGAMFSSSRNRDVMVLDEYCHPVTCGQDTFKKDQPNAVLFGTSGESVQDTCALIGCESLGNLS